MRSPELQIEVIRSADNGLRTTDDGLNYGKNIFGV